jgi:hypothetical protein
VLGEQDFASEDEASRVMGLVMALYNRINLDVREGRPALPAGIEVRPDPMANFGPDAPLGKWAGGVSAGQLWSEEAWVAHIAGAPEPEREMLEQTCEGLNMILAFFTHRDLGKKFRRMMHGAPGLEEAARRMLESLPSAMQGLAELGRGGADDEPARAPARSTKVPRNVPCPCGSGRKYKHCCGAGV